MLTLVWVASGLLGTLIMVLADIYGARLYPSPFIIAVETLLGVILGPIWLIFVTITVIVH